MPGTRVEVIVIADPDGPGEIVVYLDGERVYPDEHTVDAGAGWHWEDWRAHRDQALLEASPGCRAELLRAFNNPPGGHYVEDRDDIDWLADFPSQLLDDPDTAAFLQTKAVTNSGNQNSWTIQHDQNIHRAVLNRFTHELQPGYQLRAHNHTHTGDARRTTWTHVLYAAVADPFGGVSIHTIRYRRTHANGHYTLRMEHLHETDGPSHAMRVGRRVLKAASAPTHPAAIAWRAAAEHWHEPAAAARATTAAPVPARCRVA